MQLRWSMPAADDLERICGRIDRDSPEAARRVARTIYEGCARLKDFPRPGESQQPHARTAGVSLFTAALRRVLSGHAARRGNFAHLSRRAGLAIAAKSQ